MLFGGIIQGTYRPGLKPWKYYVDGRYANTPEGASASVWMALAAAQGVWHAGGELLALMPPERHPVAGSAPAMRAILAFYAHSFHTMYAPLQATHPGLFCGENSTLAEQVECPSVRPALRAILDGTTVELEPPDSYDIAAKIPIFARAAELWIDTNAPPERTKIGLHLNYFITKLAANSAGATRVCAVFRCLASIAEAEGVLASLGTR